MSKSMITGKTFDIRYLFQSCKGVWNSEKKAWIIDNEHLSIFENISGIEINPVPEPVEIKKEKIGNTVFYGDSKEYFNAFDNCIDPTVFCGFSSLETYVDFIENIPDEVKRDSYDGRNEAWKTDNINWRGTSSMNEAISITRKGWDEGIEIAQSIIERINVDHAKIKKHENCLAGGRVNVGRMLSGNSIHMRRRQQQSGNKIITIVNNCAFTWKVNARLIKIRASIIAAICDMLENNGYSCEIVTVHYVTGVRNKLSCIKIKNTGEHFNLSDMIFSLGHVSMFRRFNFAAIGNSEELKPIYHDFGRPEKIFKNKLSIPENMFLIDNLPHDFRTGNTLDEQIKAIIKQCVPDTLSIEFNL